MNTLAELIDNQAVPHSTSAFAMGIVTENEDKEFPGQVKVEFTAYRSGRSICRWMPLLTHYAGKEYGTYCIPEIGDKVLVGFMGHDRENPFVMGSLYPGETTFTKDSQKENNAVKQVKTKGGIMLSLDDTDSKQAVTITTPKGTVIKAEDENETVTVADAKGETGLKLDIKGGTVELIGKSTITIKSGKCEIKLDGQGGAISISCDRLDIKAAQQARLSSDQMLSISGNILQAEGKQTAQLKGGSLLELSGGMAKIN